MAKGKALFTEGITVTASLDRQWDYLADDIIRRNPERSDDELVALIRAEGGGKSAAWVRARRPLLGL